MPLVRIDVVESRSEDRLTELADAVHEAVLEHFVAPPGDRYQIVAEHRRGRSLIEDTGLGIQRTDEVVVSVTENSRADWSFGHGRAQFPGGRAVTSQASNARSAAGQKNSRTIVVGYVPTDEGAAVFDRAGEEARLRDARVVVVSSTRGDSVVAPDLPQTSALQRKISELRAGGIDCEVRNHERDNDAADVLVGVATDVGADLLVIGLTKRSPVGKFLLGSTAQRVLRESPCSVLGVRV